MDYMNKIIEEYTETRGDFIFKTNYSYCTELLERKVSKEELKRILNKGLLYEEVSNKCNELTEQSRRLTHRNNELRGKVLRLIREKEELTKTLDTQVHKIITMEYQLNKIKDVVQEVEIE